MKNILTLLFEKSVELGEEPYTSEQKLSKWIGNASATIRDIEEAENRLEIILPEDYKEMLLISNGFPTSNSAVEPTFHRVNEIDYYRNYRWNCIEIWNEIEELKDIADDLSRSIMIAGFEEEQQFLIVPTNPSNRNWKYMKFANWIPGAEEYEDLEDYFKNVIEFLDGQIVQNKK